MSKHNKRLRKKRLKKQIKGLLKQAKKHRIKAATQSGRKDTTHDYWISEAEEYERQAKEKEEKIEEIR